MVFVAVVAGVVVALVASGVVYADATRRRLRPQHRLLWSVGVGALGFGGFLIPYLYAGVVHRTYLQRVKPAPVVATPYEILVVHLALGLLVSAVAVLVYAVSTR